MNFRKIYLSLFFIIISYNIFGTDYYICLGSFIENKSYLQYNKLLNDNGIVTVLEKVSVKGKLYTRIIYNIKFNRLDVIKLELKKLKKNPVIIKYNVKNLWIRPGLLKKSAIASTDIKNITIFKNNNQNVQNILSKNEDAKKLEVKQEQEKKANDKSDKIPKDKKQSDNYQKSKYLALNEKVYGNILFSEKPIEFNKEDSDQFKTKFIKPEKIFARCYLKHSLGKLEAGNLWYEIWLNDDFKTKVVFDKVPDPEWDQLQLWISEEDFKKELDTLKPGDYKITIFVVENSASKDQINLAKGELTYIVPKEVQ